MVRPGNLQGRAFCNYSLPRPHQKIGLLKAKSSQGVPLCFFMASVDKLVRSGLHVSPGYHFPWPGSGL